eukprot:TRINITY_DN12287_c0_g1_i1.p1 TRINITY_DN12287_c0_g1~~TRINITY_DN12287_c0_g1_i1.p1  ORF type:complete len:197 (+),score=31.70 TRINITY_DN12287_c0_g1_i1:231-821(+)
MMYEPLYDELRTKQQLGYSVGCGSRDSFGVLGFSIYVLSNVQQPPTLLERIEAFLASFVAELRGPDGAAKLASHAVALAARWLEPKRTLGELQSTAWSEIIYGCPVFDRAERDVAILGTIVKDELLELLETYVVSSGRGRATIVTAVVPKTLSGTDSCNDVATAVAEITRRAGSDTTVVNSEVEFHAKSEFFPARV